MLKSFLSDRKGIITWLLTQIGLLIATGILLASIASLAFYSDWQKEAEAKEIASKLATAIESMDLKEFPERMAYIFPDKDYRYEVYVSTDYVTVKRYDGRINKKIVAREELLINPWPNPPLIGGDSVKGFYNYLESIYKPGYDGSSPQKMMQKDMVENAFEDKRKELAKDPFNVDLNKPLYIEKVFVYTNGGKEEYVILYQ